MDDNPIIPHVRILSTKKMDKMEHIIKYLKDYGITDPMQIHGIAYLILDTADDTRMMSAAEDISKMNIDQIKILLQQVLAGS